MESRSFVSFSSFWTRCRRPLRGEPLAEGWEAPLAVRIRHRDRRTRGTILSLQGPHGGDTANTILNNPVRQAEGHGVRGSQALHDTLTGPSCQGQGAGVDQLSLTSAALRADLSSERLLRHSWAGVSKAPHPPAPWKTSLDNGAAGNKAKGLHFV